MDRTPKLGAIGVAAAALTIAGAWASPAPAQIIGVPTGGSYAPSDTFAQDWYDPYDWYGRAGGIDAGTAAMPGVEGRDPTRGGFRPRAAIEGRTGTRRGGLDGSLYESPGALGEGGEADYEAPPSRPTPYRGSPYFMRGYSPYSGYRDFDDDFYDDDFYGGYGVEASDELGRGAVGADRDPLGTPAAGPTTGLGAGTVPAAAGGTPATSSPGLGGRAAGPGAAAIDAPLQIEESDELYEDYDSLYGGYGDYEYVEEGSDRYQPLRGIGPRYRNYYSEDWFDDGADFDDWYDRTTEPLGQEFAQPETREGISEVDAPAPERQEAGVAPR
ncbi:hypothetical protein [Tautonia plasticadhaerens]|uniref:Uncharacterized protein n=1 Tax=Tautonia plasticadhaerens TaxID=2527974 RepID=A0A518GUI2_9BACT|nr:hypothetical protein [Tautonia plasticadhaerens]QDV32236.1 hypothetical protein ElP_00590 [Tautonia plasticadhaerens]